MIATDAYELSHVPLERMRVDSCRRSPGRLTPLIGNRVAQIVCGVLATPNCVGRVTSVSRIPLRLRSSK